MPDVNPSDLYARFQTLLPLIVSNALNVLGAIVILIIGLWLSGRCHTWVVRALSKTPQFDAMLKSFFGSLVRYLVLTVTVLAVLSQFGIQTTSLVAVLGAAGLAVGLALQGTLSNLAAGVMLLIFRPFRIGHKVQVGGIIGTVKELSLFWTELVTDDKVQVIVPNSGVWGQPLRNFSHYPVTSHAGEARFRVPEATDLAAATGIVLGAAEAHPRVLKDPAPTLLLDRTTTENALEIVLGFSVAEDEVPKVKSDLYRTVHDQLAKVTPTA
ncbi:mechanosensitive ion channel protein [Aliidongia dinghuensis]|uniref:Small-conductance mechanosensitive channel n=1 Tax=Aliidongia dinghuensis TaxID=1867774 RepID=A0A8J2Z0B9_9PROT|nr:mechanosensitive ion channel domain-containing protein [Aliidongia dinghuensis]GGF45955.1 mechanosensitive ion channel protein [Aliidongia dinghuensis]